jgi:hypothetical protein
VFNKHNFEIAKLASTEESRFTINGIYVTPGATYVTDGHLAVKVTAPAVQPSLFPATDGIEAAEWFSPFVLDRETALKVAKAIPKKGGPSSQIVAIDTSTEVDSSATMAVNELVRQDIIRSQKLPSEFPDIEKILPDPNAARFTIAFSPALLLSLAQQIDKFCGGMQVPTVVIRLYDAQKGVRFDADGIDQKLTAVLMPQRVAETEPAEAE